MLTKFKALSSELKLRYWVAIFFFSDHISHFFNFVITVGLSCRVNGRILYSKENTQWEQCCYLCSLCCGSLLYHLFLFLWVIWNNKILRLVCISQWVQLLWRNATTLYYFVTRDIIMQEYHECWSGRRTDHWRWTPHIWILKKITLNITNYTPDTWQVVPSND
jgi:hypothetical protein